MQTYARCREHTPIYCTLIATEMAVHSHLTTFDLSSAFNTIQLLLLREQLQEIRPPSHGLLTT